MSGTSLDGLDVALCKITAAGVHTQIEVLKFTTVDYSDDYKTKIKQVFAKRECNLEYLTLLHPWVGKLHGDMVNQCLNSWQVNPANIDVIASHGQTIYHCPKSQHQYNDFNNGTLQIGDSDQIAEQSSSRTESHVRPDFFRILIDRTVSHKRGSVGALSRFVPIHGECFSNGVVCHYRGAGWHCIASTNPADFFLSFRNLTSVFFLF